MLNLSDYKEHFCEYILFRYAWANEFVKEPFPENLYEYYDSFAKAYRYLIEKIGYPVLYCGVTTSAEQILEPILAKCRMKYEQYHNLLKLYDQDEPYLMLVLQDNQQTDQRGLNVFGNAFNGGGLYISYGTYKDNVPAWKTCLLAAKLEMCYRLKEERVEVLKQVIRLMKRIEGAFCPWSYLDQMDYFQQGGCNEEEAYAYANSNMGRSARYYPHYQMWVSHLVNRLIKAGIITCEYETAELRMEDVPVENLLCIVSDECSEGLEVADGQRKRTLDAIMKALGFELLEFAELEDLDHILSRDQKAAFYRAFDEFRCDFYGEEREFVIVLIKGENAPLLSETDIFVELDYFVISFEDFFIMIYPSETGFCDGYVEITYGIGFLSWNLIPLLQMLYGKLNGNVEEFFNRSVMEQEAQPL